jgi:GNAT superfamily N-acetyltransferase
MPRKTPDFVVVNRIAINTIKEDQTLYQRLIHLSERGGAMHPWLDDHINNAIDDCIIYIAKHKITKQVIGWSIVTPSLMDCCGINYRRKIGTFVDPLFRKQGIGTRLVKAIRRIDKDFAFWAGDSMAREFYHSIIKPKEVEYHNSSWRTTKIPQ